jgi:hypothetical protein
MEKAGSHGAWQVEVEHTRNSRGKYTVKMIQQSVRFPKINSLDTWMSE